MSRLIFHPRTPVRLRRLWKEYPAFNRLARHLGVNVSYVYALMVEGEMPMNEEVRIKLFLPRRLYRPRGLPKMSKPALPDYLAWWRRLSKDERESLIKAGYEARGEVVK